MIKASDLRGFLWALLIAAVVIGLVLYRVALHERRAGAPGTTALPAAAGPPLPAPVQRGAADCGIGGWAEAAAQNAVSLDALDWAPFGAQERGWATYAPLVAREIGTACGSETPGFAAALGRWQSAARRPADGVFKPADFEPMRAALMLRRPFVRANAGGACPAAPAPSTLAAARPDEAYGGKAVQLRPAALAAYRRMVASARADGVGVVPPRLRLVSGFRSPAEEAQHCADGGCNTRTRAHCSAHRTGLALDLYLEPAPGADPTSSADANRRHMAATPEYRWLVDHAATFGFLPYAYEPWHWEWTGEAP